MFIKTLIATLALFSTYTIAESVPINGTVESKCVIQTDQPGRFGNPNAYTLTTAQSDGGLGAKSRVDVTLANSYFVTFTTPTEFSSSPAIPDAVTWTGSTEVAAVSDASGMGSYETSKIVTGNDTRYEMTAAGSTWFKTEVSAELGGNKAFPGGSYTALVEITCIAK